MAYYTKHILASIVFILLASFSTQAQEPAETVAKKKVSLALGVNISDPILNTISTKNNDTAALSSPNIYGNLGFKNWHLRAGFGGRISQQNNRSDLANNVSQVQYFNFAFSSSLLYRKDVSKKISVYAGAYFWNLYYLEQTSYDSGFDLTTAYKESIGYAVGPGAMLEYHLGKKLSIFTEYCILYRIDFGYEGQEFSAFPSESYKKHASTLHSISFQHPISIFLNYKF